MCCNAINAPVGSQISNAILSFTFVCTEYCFLFFSQIKRHNSVKNNRTWTKFKFNLYFLVKYLCMQFQLYIYISLQKLKKVETENFLFFLSSKGITLSKIIRLELNSNLIPVYSYESYEPVYQI